MESQFNPQPNNVNHIGNFNNNVAVEIFNNSNFGNIRIFISNNEPLFCLVDVCKSLGLRQNDVRQRLDDGVVSTHPIPDSLGRKQLTNFISEDGLYDVILDSRKPEAKFYRKWITSEVLPSIRKTGGYIQSKVNETPEMIMAKALQVAAKTIDNYNQRVQMLEGENELYQQEIKILEPKAMYTDKVLQSTSTFTTTQIADHFGMTANTLNQKLKDLGIQYKQSGQWHLTSKYKDKGYTDIRVSTRTSGNETRTSQNMVWTELGRQFIFGLKNEGKF